MIKLKLYFFFKNKISIILMQSNTLRKLVNWLWCNRFFNCGLPDKYCCHRCLSKNSNTNYFYVDINKQYQNSYFWDICVINFITHSIISQYGLSVSAIFNVRVWINTWSWSVIIYHIWFYCQGLLNLTSVTEILSSGNTHRLPWPTDRDRE